MGKIMDVLFGRKALKEAATAGEAKKQPPSSTSQNTSQLKKSVDEYMAQKAKAKVDTTKKTSPAAPLYKQSSTGAAKKPVKGMGSAKK